ncbi:MAG: OmpA family protein [Saprospiraceae bacterium]
MKKILVLALPILLLTSCVSKKKYLEMQGSLRTNYEQLQAQVNTCEGEKAQLQSQLRSKEDELLKTQNELDNAKLRMAALEKDNEYLKSTNTSLLDRLSDLSVINQAGAENIKKSLEAINEQNKYIKDLTGKVQAKDSLNLALVMNLKRSLSDINDEDVTVEVKKGVVYISLSDKMLFKSGSYDIQPRAETVLGKIAKVLNDHKELEILVEGHTDNVPINTNCLKDNWDLSAMRATAVVRSLQKKYGVAPERMTAGGRSEFVPKSTNATADGKSLNRRTEIVILPQLDQFFQLLEQQPSAEK